MIKITVASFGFKYSCFEDANLLFDVRCFNNPYYIDEMRDKSGLDDDVYDYVFRDADAEEFFSHVSATAELLIRRFDEKERDKLVIAFGCTGGRHRSVSFARRLCDHLRKCGYTAECLHRDVGK